MIKNRVLDGATLFVSSPFRLKTLFTKPLKYIIQLFTGSKLEHSASYCYGYVLNMGGEGGEMFNLERWIEHFAVNGAKIYCINPKPLFSDLEVSKLNHYNLSCVGQKYDALGAGFSALDEIKQIRDLDYESQKTFCSKQVFDGYVKIGKFLKQKDFLSPAELKKKLIRSPFFDNTIQRIN